MDRSKATHRGPVKPEPTGIQGREEDFGHAVAALVKTFSNRQPYEHEFNDALVKSHLEHLEFARMHDLVPEMQEHGLRTMRPILKRVRASMEEEGDKEIALVGMIDATACSYQLYKTIDEEPLARTFPCPYARVHSVGSKIGQFTFSIDEMHEQFCKARYQKYAAELGVDIDISDCHGDSCTVRILDERDKVAVTAPRNESHA